MTLDATILAGVRRQLARLRAISPEKVTSAREDGGRMRQAVNDAHAGIVSADFAALVGTPLDPAGLKACQRAAERLEAAGKVRRLRLGYGAAKVTHLELVTADGSR